MVRFEEFRVGDLFVFASSKKIYHAINVDIYDKQIDGSLPYVVRQRSNNGIRGYIVEDVSLANPKNTISFAQDTAEMFWQSQPYFTGNKVKVLTVKNKDLTESLALYLITCLKKAFCNFGWGASFTVSILQDVYMSLPILQNSQSTPALDPEKNYHPEGYIPDWKYMEKRVAELEELRVAELEELRVAELAAYLEETGLIDYILTDEDMEILSILGRKEDRDSEDALKICEEFKLVDIAKVEYGNKFDKNKMSRQNPSINFVSRTASNNGVSDFVDNNGTVPYKEGLITLALGGSIGSCFLQEQPFYTGQNVGVIDLGDIDYHAKIYFTEALGYKCKRSFNAFGNEINKHLKTDLSVSLPIKQDENNNPVIDPELKYHPNGYIPDWEYMEKYIRAIEKIVIADVVKYKDEVIKKTKRLLDKPTSFSVYRERFLCI